MHVLLIGGTRNLGHLLAEHLIGAGHRLTVLNRGLTPDTLPPGVERLRADRTDAVAMAVALHGRTWDAVVDLALYTGPDATTISGMLEGRVGHYVFIGTGQVYLVRTGAPRPAREEDVEGPVMEAPDRDSPDYSDWLYGVEKREAELALLAACKREPGRFPLTMLRLPMIHSPRDHYGRLHNYFLRLGDGGPLLVPDDGCLNVRHVWVGDVICAVTKVLEGGVGTGGGRAFNIGQDDALRFDDCLALLAEVGGATLRTVPLPRAQLVDEGLLPACSPFSGKWMSALDNTRSRSELGLRYTPMRDYLVTLADHYADPALPTPLGYAQRARELSLAVTSGRSSA